MTATVAKGNNPRYYSRELGERGKGQYYTKAIGAEHEPPGVWLGRGGGELGLEAGSEIDNEVFEELYGEFTDPRVMSSARARIADEGLEEKAATGVLAQAQAEGRLGRAPYRFAGRAERLRKALEAEPYADERRRKEIELEVAGSQRSSVNYYDVTFSAPKSWSVAHAAAQVAGRTEEADQLWAAWMDGVQAGLDHLQDKGGWSRAGRNGVRRVRADRWVVAAFRQHTSRAEDPQMHVHCPILGVVKTVDTDPVTGVEKTVWRRLDGKQIYDHVRAAGAVAERVAAESAARRVGAVSEWRPDGKAMEFLGVSQELRDAFSTRRRQVTEGVAQLAAEYEAKHGKPPGPHQLSKMAQHVTLDSRAAKSGAAPGRHELLARWEAQATRDLKESLSSVPDEVFSRPVDATAFEPRQVVIDAVGAVQAEKSSWTAADLRVRIVHALPGCLGGLSREQTEHVIESLTTEALSPGGPVDIAGLDAPEVVDWPVELRAEDGRSVYEREARRYATVEHLRREGRIVEAARAPGGPVIDAKIVEKVLAGAGLNEAQEAAVRGIATSGRMMDTLIGPAGTGKSKTISVLCEVWEAAGGRVLGVAPSQRAADVLGEEGVSNVTNLKMFLKAHEASNAGRAVSAEYQVWPGQIVIGDEGSMADTADIHEARAIVEAAGGKFLLAGDDRQLGAVGAGGMLAQLVDDIEHTYVLEEVMRFREPWERDASLRLRDGDTSVLADYDRHGRIRSGSTEEMTERAYQEWLADHLAGRDALLIAPTNTTAGELAMRARADLVRAGIVEPEGVPLGKVVEVEQFAGVGDRVALRKNNRRIVTSDGQAHWAVNRDVVTVTGRSADGGLTVRYDDGSTMALPPAYVGQHVELAYAGTVHAAEGRTVDYGHNLTDPSVPREQQYVAAGRGRVRNTIYVPTDPTPGERDAAGQPVVPDWREVMTGILDRSEREDTATVTLRSNFERAGSLETLAPIRDDILGQDALGRYGTILTELIGEQDAAQVRDTEPWENVVRLGRYIETRGFDGEAMLTEAIRSRSLVGAVDIGKVLYDRLDNALKRQERVMRRANAEVDGEQAGAVTAGEDWSRGYADRSPPLDGNRGLVMRELDAVMDARVAELGARAADTQPRWALHRLGPVPEEPMARAEWERRAGTVERYREAHGYTAEHDAIGAAPARGTIEAYASWQDAYAAIGAPEDALNYAAAPDRDLRAMVARYERAQEWAPPNVDEDLRTASVAAADYQVQASQARISAAAEADPDVRAELETRARNYEAVAEALTGRRGAYEKITTAYDAWHAHTRADRERAEAARAELDRRHPPTEEQQPAEEHQAAKPRPEPQPEPQPEPVEEQQADTEQQPTEQADQDAAAERAVDEPATPEHEPVDQATVEQRQREAGPTSEQHQAGGYQWAATSAEEVLYQRWRMREAVGDPELSSFQIADELGINWVQAEQIRQSWRDRASEPSPPTPEAQQQAEQDQATGDPESVTPELQEAHAAVEPQAEAAQEAAAEEVPEVLDEVAEAELGSVSVASIGGKLDDISAALEKAAKAHEIIAAQQAAAEREEAAEAERRAAEQHQARQAKAQAEQHQGRQIER